MKKWVMTTFLLLLGVWGRLAYGYLANDDKRGLRANSIEQVFRLDEEEIDLATAVLLCSQDAGRDINIARHRSRIDEMAYAILERFEKRRQNGKEDGQAGYRMIKTINKYLFDELGFEAVATADNSADLFLDSVLERKKGYCLSLSVLYLAIGERLGLPVYGVVVPGHFFVRYDDGKTRFNIESTAKGTSPPDEHYIEKFKVPSGGASIYMQNLSKLQTLGCFFNNLGNYYQKADQVDAAFTELQRAVEINPSVSMGHTNLGNVYLAKGLVEEAIREYFSALAINPDEAATHGNLGNAYLEKGRVRDAVDEYERAIELDPNFVEAYRGLARVYCKEELFEKAAWQLKKAMAIAPADAELLIELGDVYQDMNDYQGAVFEYLRAKRLKSDSARIHYGLARAYKQLNQLEDAIDEYKEAIAVVATSRNEKQFRAAAAEGLANIYMEKEMYDAAIEAYEKAVVLFAGNSRAKEDMARIYYNRGVAYSRKQLYNQAAESFLQAVRLQPGVGEWYNSLAACYYHLENYELAQKYLEKAKELGFTDSTERKASKKKRDAAATK